MPSYEYKRERPGANLSFSGKGSVRCECGWEGRANSPEERWHLITEHGGAFTDVAVSPPDGGSGAVQECVLDTQNGRLAVQVENGVVTVSFSVPTYVPGSPPTTAVHGIRFEPGSAPHAIAFTLVHDGSL